MHFLPQKFWALWKNLGTCKILCSLEGTFTLPTIKSLPFNKRITAIQNSARSLHQVRTSKGAILGMRVQREGDPGCPRRALFEVLTHDRKGLRKRIPEIYIYFQKFCPSICQSVHLPIYGCHHSPDSRDELATA